MRAAEQLDPHGLQRHYRQRGNGGHCRHRENLLRKASGDEDGCAAEEGRQPDDSHYQGHSRQEKLAAGDRQGCFETGGAFVRTAGKCAGKSDDTANHRRGLGLAGKEEADGSAEED